LATKKLPYLCAAFHYGNEKENTQDNAGCQSDSRPVLE
jgi:hypothetical protein